MNIKFKIILFCLIMLKSHSKSTTLNGTIKDKNNQSIISASVILKDNTGNIIAYTFTDEFGKYTLKTEKTGQFVLKASSLGFEQQSIDLIIENKNETKTIDFILNPKVTELKEIILETK